MTYHMGLLHMGFFDCNAPGTTGYSVATNGLDISTIHAHKQQADVRFYKNAESGSCPFWIYMPIDDGEYLTEICFRRMKLAPKVRSTVLAVRKYHDSSHPID